MCIFASLDLIKQFVFVRLAIRYTRPAARYSRNGLGLVVKISLFCFALLIYSLPPTDLVFFKQIQRHDYKTNTALQGQDRLEYSTFTSSSRCNKD